MERATSSDYESFKQELVGANNDIKGKGADLKPPGKLP
jgi:hypothetical protein